MQPHNAEHEQDEQSSTHESGVITALMESAEQILQRYSTQWETSKEMARLEWRITRKSLWFALVVLVIFSGVILSACIALTVLVAYGLYTLGVPIWATGLALVALHGLALYVLVRMMRGLIKRMGFHKTVGILRAPMFAQATPSSADTNGES